MGQLLLFIVVALVVAAIVFGVTVMLSGGDPGLSSVEPDGRAVPLPSDRPLGEDDIGMTKFDVAWRGYRMAEVDQALQRAAYDIGYKGELIGVLEAEVTALREGRLADADVLRRAREAAIAPVEPARAPEDEGLVVPVVPVVEEAAEGDDPLAEVGAVPPGAVPPAPYRTAPYRTIRFPPTRCRGTRRARPRRWSGGECYRTDGAGWATPPSRVPAR